LQVKVSPSSWPSWVNLKCDSTCGLAGYPAYIWYKNGQSVREQTTRDYVVYLNSEDSYSCAVKGYEHLHSPLVCVQGNRCNRVSYPTRNMCVLRGTSVDISCTYNSYSYNSYKYWFKWRDNQQPRDLQTEYEGRVEFPAEETGRSTLRITDLRDTDSAEYRFTFRSTSHEWKGTFHGTTLTVTGLRVEVTPVAMVREGQRVTLTCMTSCPLTDKPSYMWYQNNGPVTGPESPENQLVLDPVSPRHAGNYACSVRNYPHLRSPEETLTGNDDWTVTYTSSNVCSLRGSTVDITCNYRYPENQYRTSPVETLWFTKEDNKQPVDLLSDTDYAGRVEYTCGEISCNWYECKGRCTLRIRDLRQSDSAGYKFRFKTNQPGGQYTGEPGVMLSVTDLQVKVNPSGYSLWVYLTCDSTCGLAGYPAYIWYKNGQCVREQTAWYYGVYLNSEDSYSCAVEGYEHLHSPLVCVRGDHCNRVSYPTRNMCVLRGTSVDISCTYNSYQTFMYYKYWFKWRDNQQPRDLQTEYGGRVEYPAEETGRSTLRITDLRDTDSAEYRFTFRSTSHEWKGTFHGTTLTVTGLRVEVTPVATVTEGQRVTLTCMTSCPLTDKPSYMWYQNNGPVTGPESPENQLVLDPVSPRHAGNYACSVRNYTHLRSPEETLTVQYAPKTTSATVSPSGEIEEGRSVTLSCSSDANPAANYTWFKVNTDHSSRDMNHGQQLVFGAILSSDSGQYLCKAQNELGTTSDSISINVKCE
ncbi:unnamed protein product, partial [Merluccius merluccius]